MSSWMRRRLLYEPVSFGNNRKEKRKRKTMARTMAWMEILEKVCVLILVMEELKRTCSNPTKKLLALNNMPRKANSAADYVVTE